MNYSTAIFLVNKEARAVAVSYEVDANGKGVTPFTLFKTLDQSLRVGDLVIVPTETRHRMTVVRVEQVIDGADVDLDTPKDMNWVVGVVDPTEYQSILAQEGDAIAKIRSAEARARREELAAKLLKDNPTLATLGQIGDPPPLPAPTPAPGSDPLDIPPAPDQHPFDPGPVQF